MSNQTTYSVHDEVTWTPRDVTTAQDLKGAVDVVIGTFRVPSTWGSVRVKRMGFHNAAAGGAQTTAGSMKITIGGTDRQNADSVTFTAASVASHTADAAVETALNSTTTGLLDTRTKYANEPLFPIATSAQLIQLKVAVQGVGGGDQTVWPYIVVERIQQ